MAILETPPGYDKEDYTGCLDCGELCEQSYCSKFCFDNSNN